MASVVYTLGVGKSETLHVYLTHVKVSSSSLLHLQHLSESVKSNKEREKPQKGNGNTERKTES